MNALSRIRFRTGGATAGLPSSAQRPCGWQIGTAGQASSGTRRVIYLESLTIILVCPADKVVEPNDHLGEPGQSWPGWVGTARHGTSRVGPRLARRMIVQYTGALDTRRSPSTSRTRRIVTLADEPPMPPRMPHLETRADKPPVPPCIPAHRISRGWPVTPSSVVHSSPSGSIWRDWPIAIGIGTWMKALFQWPIITSVLPAIAAWTARRAN